MNKITDNDILSLKKQIDKKLKELGPSSFKPKTNLILELLGSKYNLNVLSKSDLQLLVLTLFSYQNNAKIVLKDELIISGYKISDWIDDLENKIQAKINIEKKAELSILQDRLNRLVSKELSDKLEYDDIINSYKDFKNE